MDRNDILFILNILMQRQFKNIINLLKSGLKLNGAFILPNGFLLEFDGENAKDIRNLYRFCVNHGVKLQNKKGFWNYKDGILTTPQGIKFYIDGFDQTIFAETFLYDIHFSHFDLENKVVVQAGGYIGDTPLYFAARGAKVYCFEPDLISFKRALRNIKLNPKLSKNITMENYAIGSDEFIDFPVSGSGGASVYNTFKSTAKIRSVSISTILKEFKIKNPFLLDLDIKGKEFDVINDQAISKFKMVRIEYSTKIGGKVIGSRDILIEKLKRYGFRKFRVFKHNEGVYDLIDCGTIEAIK